MSGRKRILVVDDSMSMRALLVSHIVRDARLEVVGTAANVIEARHKIKMLNPDVVTLDVEMPGMNGLEFLELIMRLRPMPVVMISTTTHAGGVVAIRALELGAVDCIAKPSRPDDGAFDHIGDKLFAASLANISQAGAAKTRPSENVRDMGEPNGSHSIIALGASTGGVDALIAVLGEFPRHCPPTVVAIHLPASFTKSFADRLNAVCAPDVVEATDRLQLRSGLVAIAPGSHSHMTVERAAQPLCRIKAAPKVNGHRPSVDVLFNSLAISYGRSCIGVLLTGMGRDGADGLLALRKAGGRTIGQDEQSSLIYGMPRVAFELGAVERQVHLNRIASEVSELCKKSGVNGSISCH